MDVVLVVLSTLGGTSRASVVGCFGVVVDVVLVVLSALGGTSRASVGGC